MRELEIQRQIEFEKLRLEQERQMQKERLEMEEREKEKERQMQIEREIKICYRIKNERIRNAKHDGKTETFRVDSLAQWLEHWIFNREDRVRFPRQAWKFFQLCFMLCYDFHVIRT